MKVILWFGTTEPQTYNGVSPDQTRPDHDGDGLCGHLYVVPPLHTKTRADNMVPRTGTILIRQAVKAVNQMLQNTAKGGGSRIRKRPSALY